jgi:hypothetical protein
VLAVDTEITIAAQSASVTQRDRLAILATAGFCGQVLAP